MPENIPVLIEAAELGVSSAKDVESADGCRLHYFDRVLAALKELAKTIPCENCCGRGWIAGASSFEHHERHECLKCHGTGKKYDIKD